MSQNESFACPNCKGPIEYRSGMGKTVTCRFCGTSVVVPKELRTAEYQAVPRNMVQPQQPVMVTVDATAGSGASMVSGCVGLVITLVIIFVVIGIIILASGGAIAAALLPGVFGSSDVSTSSNPDSLVPDIQGSLAPIISQIPVTIAPSDVPFAAITQEFGSEGTGPGFFKDARHVAVDEAGNIYVGEYSGGRIQVFGPSGNFITQWIPGEDIYLTGMAASRDGTLYAVYGGKIYKYQGLTGTLLGQVEYGGGSSVYFSTIDIATDGGLVLTISAAGEDDVFFFDAQGNFKSKIENPVTEAPGAPFDASADQIATDGLGNLYAVTSGSEPAVYKFSPSGEFLGRFTGPSEDVNGVEFTSPYDIAVDSQSRIYLSDFDGIIVLDSNGNYIRTIPDGGNVVYGIAFDYQGNLWAGANTKVLKFTIYK